MTRLPFLLNSFRALAQFLFDAVQQLANPRLARWFVFALLLVSLGLGLAATRIYGAGVSGDSIFYLSTAENLLVGRGFVDNSGEPFVAFPPLLVLTIAALAWLLRADVFLVAWFLNVLLLGVNTALASWWLYRVFRERPLYFLLGSLFLLLSVSSLRMHTAVLSDPLYLTLTLLFFFACWQYLEAPSPVAFIALLLLSMFSPLLRFSGLSQGVTAALLVLHVHRRQWKTALLLAGLLGVFSLLPLGAWIYLHNYRLYGTIWGEVSGEVNFVENVLQGFRKILYWFVPYRPISADGLLEPLLVMAVLVLVLLLLNRKNDWRNWLTFFAHPALAAMMLFAAVYFFSTSANIISRHHRDILSDRYYVIVMLPVLVILFSILDRLVLPHLRFSPRVVSLGMLIVFALWSVYPFARVEKYIRSANAGEWHNYNVFNNRVYRHSEIIQQAQKLLVNEPDAVVYSNVPRAAWFYLRRPIQRVPSAGSSTAQSTFPAGWPETPGYLVWFNRDPYQYSDDPDRLAPYVHMELLSRAEDGRIYFISLP